jgi:hypothetical protein
MRKRKAVPATPPARVSKDKMSKELLDRINSDSAGGLSHDILDNAFWRGEHQPDDEWVAALDQLDRLGNKGPLEELLLRLNLPGQAGKYMVDLIERGVPPSPSHPHTPAYAPFTRNNALLLIACESVREYIQRGVRKDTALVKVADETGLSETALAEAYEGSHTSLRRAKKRL